MARIKASPKRALETVERIDKAVADRLALDGRTRAARRTSRFAELGDQPPLIGLTLAVIAAGMVRKDEKLARTGLRMLAAHSLATMVKLAAKDNIDRTRPGAIGEKAYRLEQGNSRDGRLRSMPSGHSAGIAAVAGAFAVDYRRAIGPAAAAATAIAGAQLPARNHFLSDVLAGTAIGIAVAGIARLLIPPTDPA